MNSKKGWQSCLMIQSTMEDWVNWISPLDLLWFAELIGQETWAHCALFSQKWFFLEGPFRYKNENHHAVLILLLLIIDIFYFLFLLLLLILSYLLFIALYLGFSLCLLNLLCYRKMLCWQLSRSDRRKQEVYLISYLLSFFVYKPTAIKAWFK